MLLRYRLRRFAVGCCVIAGIAVASNNALAQAVTDPAAIVQSQERQSAALAATWLGSAEPRVRAWGAYLALRDGRQELLPQLSALAAAHAVTSAPPGESDHDAHDAMQSVLDAIIQLDGRLAPAAAARLYAHFPAQSMILLSYGDPAADPFLLRIFREEARSTGAWLTAGNRLMDRKPPGFAAAVLAGFTVRARVFVVEKGAGRFGEGSGGSCASGFGPPRAGWPTVGNYSLGDRGVLVSRGTVSTSYSRGVGGAAPHGTIATVCAFPGMEDWPRAQLLATLVGDPQGNPSVQSRISKTIEWQNDSQYMRDVSEFIREQQSLFGQLRSKLTSAGLLTAEESAASVIKLEIQIFDKRSQPSSLPRIQLNDSNVRILN